jgi:cytochrome c
MKKITIAVSIALMSQVGLFANSQGKELFTQKCAICHHLPKTKKVNTTQLAPGARGVMFHLSEAFKSKDEIKNHIEGFVINPTKEKAICDSVEKFGLMPSQKGIISKDELKTVANWMVNNLSMGKKEHESNKKKHKNR